MILCRLVKRVLDQSLDHITKGTLQFLHRSIGVVLVFDLTKSETFYNVVKWHNEILDCTHEFVEICLVGNKLDLEA